MNLRQIEVFRAVMLTGSITDAAQLLHVSQPGISRLVRHIENRLGVPLFERRKGKLLPTPEARALHTEIEKVYRGVKAIQDYAYDLKSGADAVLRVLSSPNTSLELVPHALSRISELYPKARLTLDTVPVAEMVRMLLAEQADIGISALHIDHPTLELRRVGTWRLVCVLPKGHPLARRDELSIRDILGHRLVSFDRETAQGRVIDGWFQEQRLERKVSVEVRSGRMACALVASGAGIAVVDDLTARAHAATLLSRPVPESPVFDIYAVRNRNSPESIVAARLCDEVAEGFRKFLE